MNLWESEILIYFNSSKCNCFGLPLHLISLLYISTLAYFCSKLFALLEQFTLADWWHWDAVCSSCSASSHNAVRENSDSADWMQAELWNWWGVWTTQFISLFIPICTVLLYITIGYTLYTNWSNWIKKPRYVEFPKTSVYWAVNLSISFRGALGCFSDQH